MKSGATAASVTVAIVIGPEHCSTPSHVATPCSATPFRSDASGVTTAMSRELLLNVTDVQYAERADYTSFSGDRYFPSAPRSLFVDIEYRWP